MVQYRVFSYPVDVRSGFPLIPVTAKMIKSGCIECYQNNVRLFVFEYIASINKTIGGYDGPGYDHRTVFDEFSSALKVLIACLWFQYGPRIIRKYFKMLKQQRGNEKFRFPFEY